MSDFERWLKRRANGASYGQLGPHVTFMSTPVRADAAWIREWCVRDGELVTRGRDAMADKTRRVSLPGHGVFWFIENKDGDGPLAPLDHCDQSGNIVDADVALFAESYAHVFANGEIKRFHQVIGHRADLVDVEPDANGDDER